MLVVWFSLFLNILWHFALSEDVKELIDTCLDGQHHKSTPGPESQLFSQCLPWKNRSCCTYNTTENLHGPQMYGFNLDHCGAAKNMSERCRRHFIQDYCFYECSPNIGPWVVKVDMKLRKERFYQVPLCESDCESWFSACENDFTCTDNWMRNFIWEKGKGNKCFPGTECKTFKKIFSNASNFCQKVWDDSWKVVKDSEACMRLWFDGSAGNPNNNVARYYADQLVAAQSTSSADNKPQTSVYYYIATLCAVKFTYLLRV